MFSGWLKKSGCPLAAEKIFEILFIEHSNYLQFLKVEEKYKTLHNFESKLRKVETELFSVSKLVTLSVYSMLNSIWNGRVVAYLLQWIGKAIMETHL